eukprot:5911665-Amphidinium_carterae.2
MSDPYYVMNYDIKGSKVGRKIEKVGQNRPYRENFKRSLSKFARTMGTVVGAKPICAYQCQRHEAA